MLIDQHGQRECQQEEEKLCDGSTSEVSVQIQHPDDPCAEGFESGQDLLCPDVLGSKPFQIFQVV